MAVGLVAGRWVSDGTCARRGLPKIRANQPADPRSGARPSDGYGKPERLTGDLSGCWSRRIGQEHRVVYTVDGDQLVVLQARYHC